MREEVPAALDGQRVDRVVAMLTGISRAEVAALLEAGAVTVDGQPATKGSTKLQEGAVVEVDVPDVEVAPPVVGDASIPVRIVHEDAAVVVVDKPAGLVVHPGAGQEVDTLAAALLGRYPELAGVGDADRPGIVHRLDKGTSGLLVVARTPEARESLVGQLSDRSVERRYDALAWGSVESAQGLIDAPIGRSPRQPTKMGVTARGREARTRYQVVQRFAHPVDLTLLSCRLETGRTHQIRVHLAAIGHPVVGDDRYDGVRQVLACPRPFLHAARLGFTHPTTGERLVFDSPLPDDLRSILDTVRAQNPAEDPGPTS